MNVPEGLHPFPVNVHVMLKRSLFTLSEPVDVEYSDQVVKLVVRREGQRLPDTPLCGLSVSDQTVGSVTARIQVT